MRGHSAHRSTITTAHIRPFKLPPTRPQSDIKNCVVSLVSQPFRNREHGKIHFPQNSPTQSCLPPDCAHLVHPARNPTFHELVKAFSGLQQPICDVPLHYLRNLTFVLKEPVARVD